MSIREFRNSGVIKMETRQALKKLLKRGVTQVEAARQLGVSLRSALRIAHEELTSCDDREEHKRRGVGRPSCTAPYRGLVERMLKANPALPSREVYVRLKKDGYTGARTAAYEMTRNIRDKLKVPTAAAAKRPGRRRTRDVG